MEILKQYENASVAEIEARIEADVNTRDAMNEELLALNHLRDRKVKEARKQAAAAAFMAEHGEHPTQVVTMNSAVAGSTVKGPGLFEGLKSWFKGG